jgi:hypothetical protein
VLRTTLLGLILAPIGTPAIRAAVLGLAVLALLYAPLPRKPGAWALLTLLAGLRMVLDWPLANNHAYLLGYLAAGDQPRPVCDDLDCRDRGTDCTLLPRSAPTTLGAVPRHHAPELLRNHLRIRIHLGIRLAARRDGDRPMRATPRGDPPLLCRGLSADSRLP